jgi:formylglycine-generating enzyme required for sulfatase activity
MDTTPFLIPITVLLLSVPVLAQKAADAGECARCHINTTVDWAVSKHKTAGVTCTGCHGRSQDHVIEERNHVKPDRMPQGSAIVSLCRDCHRAGCGRTKRQDGCQACHHVHVLIELTRKPDEIATAQMAKALELSRNYQDAMSAGEALAGKGRFRDALAQFEGAGRIRPGDQRAALRATFCRRRLNPPTQGLRVINDRVDPETGLPTEVEIAGIGLRLLAVPGGAFDIGSDAFRDSRPVHTVRIEPFYLGQYEVTQEQWEKVMGSNPSLNGKGIAERFKMPVDNVSWHDCQEFIDRLNRTVPGGGFRLPTEAEWEFVARYGGQTAETAPAWSRENSQCHDAKWPDFTDLAPHPVGSKPPNPLGFYDMRGNVWEWCSSLFQPYPFDLRDGREDQRAEGLHVLRGGSYADSEDMLHPALRHADRPMRRFRWNGFRLARQVQP